jgi:amylovoran biosynthesis glycosyltransferase AmsD
MSTALDPARGRIATVAPASATPRRRVAVFINDMSSAGGIQRVAANLVRDLRRHYETMLLSVEPLKGPMFHEPGLDFRSLNVKRGAWTRMNRVREFTRVGLLLRKFVKENRIDTVLAIWYDWASVAALALPSSVKKVGCEHISYCEPTPNMSRFRSRSYPYLDAVVSLTAEDQPLLARISRMACVIPNHVVHVEPRPVEEREKILLMIGHLESRKGIDRLLWALKQPLLEHPDWKLVVVGGGERGHVDWGYMDYVSVLLNVLGLRERVEFHPATRHIDRWYQRASVYVMGSRREGLPMVLIEAKAYGLPIVSFDCPTGPKEIVHPGIDGFLIKDDSEDFAEATMSLMRDIDLRRRMSRAARADFAKRFSTESVIAKWHELIEAIHNGQTDAVAAKLGAAGALKPAET